MARPLRVSQEGVGDPSRTLSLRQYFIYAAYNHLDWRNRANAKVFYATEWGAKPVETRHERHIQARYDPHSRYLIGMMTGSWRKSGAAINTPRIF